MDKKLVFVFALVALFALTTAKPQDDGQDRSNVNIVDGGQQIDFVDGGEQVHFEDNPSQANFARGGGSKK